MLSSANWNPISLFMMCFGTFVSAVVKVKCLHEILTWVHCYEVHLLCTPSARFQPCYSNLKLIALFNAIYHPMRNQQLHTLNDIWVTFHDVEVFHISVYLYMLKGVLIFHSRKTRDILVWHTADVIPSNELSQIPIHEDTSPSPIYFHKWFHPFIIIICI